MAEATQATYDELRRRARTALTHGESVVLDASWSDAARREEAETLSRETSAGLVQIRCQVAAAVAVGRLRARTGDASDAGPEVAAAMRRRFAAWPQAYPLSTAGSVQEAVVAVEGLIADAR